MASLTQGECVLVMLETRHLNMSVIFSTGVRPKGCRIERGDLEESRRAICRKEVCMGVSGAGRALRKREGDPWSHLEGLKGP